MTTTTIDVAPYALYRGDGNGRLFWVSTSDNVDRLIRRAYADGFGRFEVRRAPDGAVVCKVELCRGTWDVTRFDPGPPAPPPDLRRHFIGKSEHTFVPRAGYREFREAPRAAGEA
jgi:hypothetical protein